jgi:hypothetical protein
MLNRIACVLVGFGIALGGCAVGIEGEEGEDLGLSADALKDPRMCPMVMTVKCPEGYRNKQLQNCNQLCVPDNGPECREDADCGAIYCVTYPCPQPVCDKHQCVVPTTPPETGGDQCGNNVCAPTDYCCNSSCGICAPPDGMCIMLACTTG